MKKYVLKPKILVNSIIIKRKYLKIIFYNSKKKKKTKKNFYFLKIKILV
jgi:hypothetical protein